MKYIVAPIFFLFSSATYAQKLTYDIFLFGSRIGQTVIEKTAKNDSTTQYMLNSESEAHLFFTKRTVTLHYDIMFINEKYFSSYCKHTRNDEVHYTNITRQGEKYLVKRDKEAFYLDGSIDCSTVKLFYYEPCSLDHMLSERLGEFRRVKKNGNGVYEAEMSDGITYYYHYKNGKMVELEMRKGLMGSIYLRLQQ